MPKCEFCNGEMKPLFQSWYCPKDCDRQPQPTFNSAAASIDKIITNWFSQSKPGIVIKWNNLKKYKP